MFSSRLWLSNSQSICCALRIASSEVAPLAVEQWLPAWKVTQTSYFCCVWRIDEAIKYATKNAAAKITTTRIRLELIAILQAFCHDSKPPNYFCNIADRLARRATSLFKYVFNAGDTASSVEISFKSRIVKFGTKAITALSGVCLFRSKARRTL